MKRKIYLIVLSSFIFGGCSILSPFKPVTSCGTPGGAPCATVESNLEYSANKDNETGNNTEALRIDNATATETDEAVMKDEIGRIMGELGISGERPTMIPPTTYRVLIYPYTAGEKYYSARYVYITAGKPVWISGNKAVAGGKTIRLNGSSIVKADDKTDPLKELRFGRGDVPVPAAEKDNAGDEVKSDPEPNEIKSVNARDINVPSPESNHAVPDKALEYRVAAYYLNCRDTPSIEGTAIATFETDTVLEVLDRDAAWWRVSYYDTECYVNSKYLYGAEE